MSASPPLRLVPSTVVEENPAARRDLVTRWGGIEKLFDKGWVPVPVLFLEMAPVLKPFSLTPAEILFVINLMVHKWDARSPFPGYKRLADLMGVTDSYARKMARSLEKKRLLQRNPRVGNTNEFDLTPLFTALSAALRSRTPVPAREANHADS